MVGIMLLPCSLTFGAANIFFFKVYNEDFKKSNTRVFYGGDPIYGLINVTPIAIGDDETTSVEEFSNSDGSVTVRLFFPDQNQEIAWRVTLSSGRVKNNRFLFCLMPGQQEKLDEDYFKVLKIFNQYAGKKLTMDVRVGEEGSTAWYEETLTIDLTRGAGDYADWLGKAPAAIRNTNMYYNVCTTRAQTYVDFRRDEVLVRTLTKDSLIFESGSSLFRATKPSGYNFYAGGKDVYTFYASAVDDKSFVVYQPHWQAYTYFHMDKSKAQEQDVNKRCPMGFVERFDKDLQPYLEELKVADQNDKAEKDKKKATVVTKYVLSLKSMRTDPALEKKVMNFWNVRNPEFPAVRVIFLDPDYTMVRDKYNQVLRKSLATMIIYKSKEGKCWAQWNHFGFEHLGGGAFNEDVGAWYGGIIHLEGTYMGGGENYTLDSCK
jgi:hypothetical protein